MSDCVCFTCSSESPLSNTDALDILMIFLPTQRGQSQALFLTAGSTNPEVVVRDYQYHERGYRLSSLNWAFCFRFYACSYKRAVFLCHLNILPHKMNQSHDAFFIDVEQVMMIASCEDYE